MACEVCRKKERALQNTWPRAGAGCWGKIQCIVFRGWKNPTASKWSGTGLGQAAPKTVERTSQDPALVPDRSKFKSLLWQNQQRQLTFTDVSAKDFPPII